MILLFFLHILVSSVFTTKPNHVEVEVVESVLDWGVNEKYIEPAQRDVLKKELLRRTFCNVTIEEAKETQENLENLFSEFVIYEAGIVAFVGGLYYLVMQADMISPNGVLFFTLSAFFIVSMFADILATAYKTTKASIGIMFFVALISLPMGFFGIHYKLNQPGKKWNKKWLTNYLFAKLKHFPTCCFISEIATMVIGTIMLIKLQYTTPTLLIPIFISFLLFLDNVIPYFVSKFYKPLSPAEYQLIFFVYTFCFGWLFILFGSQMLYFFNNTIEVENLKFWVLFFGSFYVSVSLFGAANIFWHPKLQIGLIWVHVMLAHYGIYLSFILHSPFLFFH
jgi:hypothetical protein